jgi:hypothetical protein
MDEEDVAALVIDNGSGMCKGASSAMFYNCSEVKFDFLGFTTRAALVTK